MPLCPCNLTYSQVTRIRAWTSLVSHYSACPRPHAGPCSPGARPESESECERPLEQLHPQPALPWHEPMQSQCLSQVIRAVASASDSPECTLKLCHRLCELGQVCSSLGASVSSLYNGGDYMKIISDSASQMISALHTSVKEAPYFALIIQDEICPGFLVGPSSAVSHQLT